jgi:hypothetical protein
MPDYRKFFPAQPKLDEFVTLWYRNDGPMRMFATLRPNEQLDVIEGRCNYREYQGNPILDYTNTKGSNG